MSDKRNALRARLRGLYAITPEGLDDDALIRACELALGHGVRILQFRDKSHHTARRLVLARTLARLCRWHDALFIVNDDVALAIEVDADGVHLGAHDGDPVAARTALPDRLIGASCYADLARAEQAVAAGADYVAFGSVFASSTKPDAVRAPLALFARARALDVPVVAIGGITRANCAAVRSAGADACAVISDLFGNTDEIAQRAQTFQALLETPTAASAQPHSSH